MARTRLAVAAQEAAEAARQKAEATAAATSAVLKTAELLEMILLHLPLNELLVAQRVSTFWKDSIRQSEKTQQSLYLRPFGEHLVRAADTYNDFFQGEWTTVEDEDSGTVVKPILNPIMTRYFFTWFNYFVSVLNVGFVTPIFNRAAYIHESGESLPHPEPQAMDPRSRSQLLALHRNGASWKNMLLMQPPCSEISMVCGLTDGTFLITNPQGVTLQRSQRDLEALDRLSIVCRRKRYLEVRLCRLQL